MGANPPQAPEHLRHVAAEDTPVGVHFVDDHKAQAGEKRGPGGVVGEQPQVQHVRVADEDLGVLRLEGLALRGWRVPVVDGRPNERGGQGPVQLPQGLELVLLQGLQGEEVERVPLRVLQKRFQDRQIIDERLAAGRGRGHQDIPARPDGRQGLPLVVIQPGDAQTLQGLSQGPRQPNLVGIRRGLRLQVPPVGEDVPVVRGLLQLIDEIFEHGQWLVISF